MISNQFDRMQLGHRFGERATLSDWHFATATALFYDAGPNHVDPEHSAHNRFGGMIAPGFLTAGVMMGVVGRHFGWCVEAFLESHVKFVACTSVKRSMSCGKFRELQPKGSFGRGL